MAHRVDVAITELAAGMRILREAIRGIPVRREGFKKLHDEFARSVGTMTVNISYSRNQLRK